MGGQNLGTSRQSLVSWSLVDSETQERFGLVSISTGCSGCLIRSDWVVSAAHCFELTDSSNEPIPDPSRPGQFMLEPLGSVSVTANWPGTLKDRAIGSGTSTSHTRWAKRIETFRPHDVALVQVTEPFSTPSLPAGEARMVNADGQFPYFGEEMSMHLTVFGRGINQFASGSGDTATPSSSDGQYRLGYAKVDDRNENLYWYSGGAGGYIAGGDSGGPSFCWTYSGYALVGVHAQTLSEVVPGKDTKTEPWKWVTSTPKAADAPLRPLAAQMAAVMGALPRRQAAGTSFIGVFPNSGPSADLEAIATFRWRAEVATQQGFATGFPNFHQARRGLDHFGGTVMIKSDGVEWRNPLQAELKLRELGNFGDRMRAAASYASKNGFVGGLPMFLDADYGDGTRLGTFLLKPSAAEWRDVPLYDLDLKEADLGDIGRRFRATQDYAVREGFVGGFPNMFHAKKTRFDPMRGGQVEDTVCGTVLLRPELSEWKDVLLFRDPS